MHDHGTAVLDRTTEATPAAIVARSARQRWLDRCEADLAEALATKNACLLPLIADVLSAHPSELCQGCHCTGYTHDGKFDLCYCMADDIPAYDYPRHTRTEILSQVTARHDGLADVWMPCPHCEIGPIQGRPCSKGAMIRVPWNPDCPACHDTGWVLSRTVPASDVFTDW